MNLMQNESTPFKNYEWKNLHRMDLLDANWMRTL